jgi:hypothetical protein
MWRAHCETTVNKGRTLPSNQQPQNNGSDLCFLCGLSQGNNRGSRVLFAACFVEVFSLWSVHGLYNQGHQPASLVSGESSAEELVDGQWEPVGSAGGPGPWRNSAGVVTQLWESVVILRRLGKYYSELWSCKSVYTVIVCNCVWSN